MDSIIKYSIDIASRKSGLSKNTIRAWENRFNILMPERTDTKRRLYTESDIHRLSLLSIATQSGYRIGNIHTLSNEELERISNTNQSIPPTNQHFDFNLALKTIIDFDEIGLRELISKSIIENSKPVFINNIILPLVDKIGSMWMTGKIRISHEHFASAVISSVLIRMRESDVPSKTSRRILVCTPSGQRHEIGSLIASVLINSQGWQVVYLGADLPAEEIAGAAIDSGSVAIAMSIIFPVSESLIVSEIKKLSEYIPDKYILIGSNRISNDVIPSSSKIFLIKDFNSLSETLNQLY